MISFFYRCTFIRICHRNVVSTRRKISSGLYSLRLRVAPFVAKRRFSTTDICACRGIVQAHCDKGCGHVHFQAIGRTDADVCGRKIYTFIYICKCRFIQTIWQSKNIFACFSIAPFPRIRRHATQSRYLYRARIIAFAKVLANRVYQNSKQLWLWYRNVIHIGFTAQTIRYSNTINT